MPELSPGLPSQAKTEYSKLMPAFLRRLAPSRRRARWALPLLTGLLLLAPPADARTWTNLAGVAIEADLVRVEGDQVFLRKDGRVFQIAEATLSTADQAFLREAKPTTAAAAAAPAASGPVSKKGACLAARQSDWLARLKSLNVGWYYQWKAERSADAPATPEFVPMVFGKPNQIGPAVAYVTGEKAAFTALLGYNEPDKADQADMTVEAALAAWPQLMSTGLPLVSPACANPEGEWMEAFMAGIKKLGYRVDYIGVHSYGGPSAAAFLEKLERLHRKYDLPLWITEFAVGDWQAPTVAANKHSAKTVADFMRAVLPKLDRLKYVARYAWFSADPSDPHLGTSALFNADGTLTELGEIYAKH